MRRLTSLFGYLGALRAYSVAIKSTGPGACPLCSLNEDSDTLLYYYNERRDGCGARALDVVASMAVAAKTGVRFGGVVTNAVKAHGTDCNAEIASLFGNQLNFFTGNPYKCPSARICSSVECHSIYEFQERLKHNHGNTLHLRALDEDQTLSPGVAMELTNHMHLVGPFGFLTASFVKGMRAQAASFAGHARHFTGGALPIAMHVRRGDVTSSDMLRWVSDEDNFRIIDVVREVLPKAQIHIFSSAEGNYSSASFEEYRRRGALVHLHDSVIDTWAHFIKAKLFIMGRSSFSYVPALLSTGCVVYQQFMHAPLSTWIHLRGYTDMDMLLLRQSLRACLSTTQHM